MAVLSHDGEKSYVGRVLREREHNGYNDSDFYAQVVGDSGIVMWVEFATTRGGCGQAFGTYLDATDEALDAAEAAWRGTHFAAKKERDVAAARWPEKGKTVKLTRTYRSRKLKLTLEAGTEGTVFWIGEDQYQDSRMTAKAYRVGVEFAEGKLFLKAGVKSGDGLLYDGDVEVVGWEELLTSDTELQRQADASAAGERRRYEKDYGGKYAEGRKRNEKAAVAA